MFCSVQEFHVCLQADLSAGPGGRAGWTQAGLYLQVAALLVLLGALLVGGVKAGLQSLGLCGLILHLLPSICQLSLHCSYLQPGVQISKCC